MLTQRSFAMAQTTAARRSSHAFKRACPQFTGERVRLHAETAQ